MRANRQEGPYLCDVIKLNKDVVDLTVGELAHHVPVLVIWFFLVGPLLTAALLLLAVLVHEVVLIVDIILANVNVAEGVGDGLGGRRLKVL